METLILNIITKATGSKILRSEIFNYFKNKTDKPIERVKISRALVQLEEKNLITAYEVPGEFYLVTEYALVLK
jgi:UTP-glucose-1-phosphate uridylyltransferase